MGDRIYIGSNGNTDVSVQESSLVDLRYRGLIPKKRLHPRLIVRRFRNVSGGLGETNPLEFHNFILEEAIEDVEEKFQIVQTFGPDFIFLYGPKPRIFTYSGRLMNTADMPWKNDWQCSWDRRPSYKVQDPQPPNESIADKQRGLLSGTNVILAGGITRLEYDGSVFPSTGSPSGCLDPVSNNPSSVIVREGYLIKLQIRIIGAKPNNCPFSFSMAVTNSMYF